MTSTQVRPEASKPVAPGRRDIASQRDDIIGVLCGLALVGGVLADAWAHSNILSTLEGFFTPWHALLYTGFAATAAWTWWLAFRQRRTNDRWWANGWPVGYGIGALGSLVFLAGGAGDMFWHEIFGVETSLKAALSPSHVVLSAGGVLLLTSQLRSWWASGEGGLRTITGVTSAALGTVMGTILIAGMLGLSTIAPTRAFEPVQGQASTTTAAAQGIQSYLLATAVLLIPILLIHRRRSTPVVATAIAGAIGLFSMVQREFPMPLTAALIGMIVGAAIADTVLFQLDARRGLDAPLRLPIAGAVFAFALWAGHLLGLQIAAGIAWPAELWAGTIVMSTVLGALIGTLTSRPSRTG